MAGMEQLEIHSKSYLVRWLHVSSGNTISWSIQPHKKSLNFGIFKHPGASSGASPNFPTSATLEGPQTPNLDGTSSSRPRGKSNAASRNENSTVVEKLQSIGLQTVAWTGKCEADKVSMGKYDVGEGEGGMYGLVFDNTFSKQVSKTVTFVLMTYSTNSPPKSGHHLHFSQALATGSTPSLGNRASPGLQAVANSSQSLPQDFAAAKAALADPRPRSAHGTETKTPTGSTFYTGILHKKRRKKNQGYARRFFSLDFTSSTLSYYHDRNSSALRGAIPLSLAVIGTDEKRREISVDSGAEIWHLKANSKDFRGWKDALERASQTAVAIASPEATKSRKSWPAKIAPDPDEEREWARVEGLVGRVAGTRDAVRRLAKDTDPKYMSTTNDLSITKTSSNSGSPSPSESETTDYFKQELKPERPSFWKRKPSSTGVSPSGLFRRSVSAQLAVPAPTSLPAPPNGPISIPKRPSVPSYTGPGEENVHEHCMAILRDLDTVVREFSTLVAESRQRRMSSFLPVPSRQSTRHSIESMSDEEFFDADDGDDATVRSQMLTINRDSDDSDARSGIDSEDESDLESNIESPGFFERKSREGASTLIPSKPKSLTPLPLDQVKRRRAVPPAKGSPPSLIGFLRKNVGKDLSTIAMPVSANEPLSLVQRVSEQLEYSELLDAAVSAPAETGERILTVAAFAISSFSNNRVKVRADRKPFNPMLGETFELVREDKGFRAIAEKISHRPVRLAIQAESPNWTFWQSPMPVQKFWGKSAELNTEGRAQVVLHDSGEHYSWALATSFLRNMIAGEKYVEPVGDMTIVNEVTGTKAVVTFKAGGMFAGRSEEVNIQAYDAKGIVLPTSMTGKWTSQLNLTNGKNIWTAGPLVESAEKRYGFTTFAASLNEISSVEKDHLPPTDSRLRPDQRAHENGFLDEAEGLKARLEQRQRDRGRVMEEHGEEWSPRWFVQAPPDGSDEEVWRLKTGKDGYWEERAKGTWSGVQDVLRV